MKVSACKKQKENMKSEKAMDKSTSKAEFDSVDFEKRLTNLKDTQESIQVLSSWCLQNRSHHKKIVTSWLLVLKQGKNFIYSQSIVSAMPTLNNTIISLKWEKHLSWKLKTFINFNDFISFLVKVEHRLTLFYLANDVIQYSKRKNYEFVESWGTALQRATTMVR